MIWCSHTGGYEEYYLMEYNVLLTFNRLHGVVSQKMGWFAFPKKLFSNSIQWMNVIMEIYI
jgi:hypothetical protein